MNHARIAVVQFPGANCERETHMALKRVGLEGCDVYWNQTGINFDHYAGFIIIGGFSYEDRGRAGLIAAQDTIMQKIKIQAAKGKPVLGICNGAQILIESGMLIDDKHAIALTDNMRLLKAKPLGNGYYNDWVYIKPESNKNEGCFHPINLKQPIYLPIAHAEGRFVMAKNTLDYLMTNGATLWRYCDASGKCDDAFPINPNGSVYNLAGITNAAGNILALMPHPERTTNGDILFSCMKDYILASKPCKKATKLTPKPSITPRMQHFSSAAHSLVFVIQSQITDDAAISLQKVLKSRGYEVPLTRYRFIEIVGQNDQIKQQYSELCQTGELYNPNKETLVTPELEDNMFLVRPNDDLKGLMLTRTLRDCYGFSGIDHIETGLIWCVDTKDSKDPNLLPYCKTLLHHPLTSQCLLF